MLEWREAFVYRCLPDIPLPADADSELVAEKYYATVFRLHGMPSAIVSDRDPKFTSQFWRALQAKIGTVLRMSTAAHPETDGSSKNRIKMVTQTLRIMKEQYTTAPKGEAPLLQ
ncbi:BZ3500_MvSof-1268-A1-R1_Chr5-2g07670 [Microbotryum saponariae]|uniref:BZ3500_MvSof-1268-A1-R1_Chr5-1g07666 protein n=1 Tax=Microbotryum saponariae TaxID=289078 RepID=A0A2X0MHX7_9BASI|nr:BZ3500_MvSof-1268-A1-R1_Chr5-1g07666 [Microbotryum saponariae]SCZ92155.1 BZ3500_MvSof-1268-A1-R1_Chr5-2g07670 [Microbotryum saponariae]SDA05538.1 BZ3501_MvSof-1269-A2-R1_Chr5-2g07491 [Microbotryum saponariae]